MNADIRPDQMPDGLHRDAQNMRMGSVDGNSGSLESIGGQEVIYPPSQSEEPLDTNYVCIGMIMAGKDLFSVHASPVQGYYPIIKINGVAMASSGVIPYTYDRPLQLRVLDRKQGPIVHPVDGNAPALFWDVEAIKAAYASGLQFYFEELNIQSISVVPPGPTEWPEHTDNPKIGAGVGAKPGQYAFWLRYYDRDGNRSNFGPPTPLISVAGVQAPYYSPNSGSHQYPGGQTTGGETAGADITSDYGIALKWQIDNQFDIAGWELIVAKFNEGQGLADPGETEVVARQDMVPGEFDFVEFVYPRDNNFTGTVPPDEAQQQFVNFTAPKAVEVIDNRVIYANFTLRNEVVQLEFQDVNGSKTFPFTSRVFTRQYDSTTHVISDYNDGFSDPVNNTYKKSAAHNERYSVGLMLWDGSASRSSVVNVQDNVLLPERGRRKNGDSLKYSTDPIYRTNTECQSNDPVSATFDAIVQGTVRKEDSQYTNVVNGSLYRPFTPKGPTDVNYVRYKQKPILGRLLSIDDGRVDTGAIFAPQVHSLGVGIYGPSNLDQEAPWCEVMSVMRTAPAGRVVASGMGVYSQTALVKSSNTLRAYFPDLNSEVVPDAIRQDIEANPQRYRVKLTPYGFYSEVYSYSASPAGIGSIEGLFGDFLDFITYMDMQRDTGDNTPYGVNVGEPAMGIGLQPVASAPFDMTNNVGWQAWRRRGSDLPTPSVGNPLWWMDQNNLEQGAAEIPLTSFSSIVSGRVSLNILQTDRTIYSPSQDLTSGATFDETNTRRYHGPVWIVDILRSDKTVPNLNVQQYLHTGTHIATDRTIGLFLPGQDPITSVEMFHARPYDAIPRVPQQDIRYAYVRVQGQPDQRWMHGANFTNGVTFATIAAAIAQDGYWVDAAGNRIYGIYGSDFNNNLAKHPIWFLTFESFLGLPVPPTGARIVVKYDNREPILSHGFDCTIAPTTWTAIDAPTNVTAPMPYPGGVRASQYILPKNPTLGGSNSFEYPFYFNTRSIRQWAVMGHVVTRTPQFMNTGGGNKIRYSFPRTHYIIRPTSPASLNSGTESGLDPTYDFDYPGEAGWFDYGGFKTENTYNYDYSKQPNVSGTGVPLNGQNPRTLLPTGHIASLPYNPLSSDSPGLRTFTFDNLFIVDEAMGEVKMIAAIDQGGRQALWGHTEKGYYNIPYNAQMLTDAEGNVIATQSVGTFWPRRENWITRDDHGMPDEFWRMAVKMNIPIGTQNVDTVAWVDRNSVYMLSGAVATDIAVNKIRSVLLPTLAITPGDGRPGYSAVYNKKNEELWITMLADGRRPGDTGPIFWLPRMYAFDMSRKEWVGRFTYNHEQYASNNDRVFAGTGLTIYEVNTGDAMNGDPIESSFTVPFFMDYQLRKEAMRWRLVGDMPMNSLTNPDYTPYLPSSVEVLDAGMNVLSQMDGTQYALWAKNYDGFEGWVNRVLASINFNRPLPQSQGFFLRVSYNTFGRKVASSVGMQLKAIK